MTCWKCGAESDQHGVFRTIRSKRWSWEKNDWVSDPYCDTRIMLCQCTTQWLETSRAEFAVILDVNNIKGKVIPIRDAMKLISPNNDLKMF